MKHVIENYIYNNIPDEFKRQDNWIVLRYEEVSNQQGETKTTKKPYRADGRGCAKTNDPSTWAAFQEAVEALRTGKYDGIGWCVPLESDKTYWGFDMDDGIDPDTGEFRVWKNAPLQPEEVFDFVKGGYVEITPSEAGFRFFVVRSDGANVPPGAHQQSYGTRNPKTNKVPGVEIYNRVRYFTFSGRKLPGCGDAILDDAELCDRLHQTFTRAPERKAKAPQPTKVDLEVAEDELGELAIKLAAERKPGSSRHHLVLGVTGVLLRNSFSVAAVETVIKYLVAIFSDQDSAYDCQQRLAKHLPEVKSAAAKLKSGQGDDVAGMAHLINHDVFNESG